MIFSIIPIIIIITINSMNMMLVSFVKHSIRNKHIPHQNTNSPKTEPHPHSSPPPLSHLLTSARSTPQLPGLLPLGRHPGISWWDPRSFVGHVGWGSTPAAPHHPPEECDSCHHYRTRGCGPGQQGASTSIAYCQRGLSRESIRSGHVQGEAEKRRRGVFLLFEGMREEVVFSQVFEHSISEQ